MGSEIVTKAYSTLCARLREALLSRPVRLTLMAGFVGIIFPDVRLSAFALVYVIALYYAFKSYRSNKTPYFFALVTISAVVMMVHGYSYYDYSQVKRYMEEHAPLSLEMVSDGEYVGSGQGFRGPIELKVSVRNHRIDDIELLRYQDIVNGLDELRNRIGGSTIYLEKDLPRTAFGIIQTAAGFQTAIVDALWQGVEGRPSLRPITEATYSLLKNHFSKITVNSMAIIFIIILTFDFFLQPALTKDTGQSLNCYNCQACVGACPVKIVDGEPFPMTMVLMARLGDYEKVAKLARYCVGCGRCAAKCPIGNSGPVVAAACVLFDRHTKRDGAPAGAGAEAIGVQENVS